MEEFEQVSFDNWQLRYASNPFPSPSQESQKIFKSRYGLEPEPIKAKLIGFGMQLLEGIDPNPENYVTAGIIHNSRQQIGVLCRLEPNKQALVSYSF